jgi:hypothetical protein
VLVWKSVSIIGTFCTDKLFFLLISVTDLLLSVLSVPTDYIVCVVCKNFEKYIYFYEIMK